MKVFLDFDGTLVNSGETICKIYNEKYKPKENGIKAADFKKCRDWPMSDVCPFMSYKELQQIFASGKFFEEIKFFEGMKEGIGDLHRKGVDITIVSRGDDLNIMRKIIFISEALPYVTQIPVIAEWDKEIDKGCVNMSGGIFVDDKLSNILSSNAKHTILFNEYNKFDLDWNKGDYNGRKAHNSISLFNTINSLLEGETFPKSSTVKYTYQKCPNCGATGAYQKTLSGKDTCFGLDCGGRVDVGQLSARELDELLHRR